MDWKEVSKELQKPLHPGAVKPPAPGKYGEYVDSYHVITEANRIFGENGWSYTVTRLEKVSEGTFTIQKRDGDSYEQTRVGYLATVRVNVDGVEREGAAVGNGAGKPENVADLHESAVKEAETDALKRALRTFGNTFGLALYDKTKSNVGIAVDYEAMRDRMVTDLEGAADGDALQTAWKVIFRSAGFREMPEDMRKAVTKAKDDRKAALADAAHDSAVAGQDDPETYAYQGAG